MPVPAAASPHRYPLAALWLFAACSGAQLDISGAEIGPRFEFAAPRAETHHAVTIENLSRVARQAGLAARHRDLAVVCQPRASAERGVHEIPECQAVRIEPSGATRTLGAGGLRAAQRLAGERMLLLGRDLDLSVVEPSGAATVVARSVFGPRVSLDGERVVYAQLPAGTTRPEPGQERSLMLYDLRSGARRVVTRDPDAAYGWLVPGTEEVLFVSGRTGVASLWLGSPGAPDRQLTNVGMTRAQKGVIPVPARELVWLPGTRRAVFTARYERDLLWLLDAADGQARLLGPGRLPELFTDGGVIAVDGNPPAALRYLHDEP